ncbi:MAG: hypothetical protein H6707_04230 [Deltaproteobacteria bacterium]|nr:hypothetical protein [Deltaproteobacteria bacterium]
MHKIAGAMLSLLALATCGTPGRAIQDAQLNDSKVGELAVPDAAPQGCSSTSLKTMHPACNDCLSAACCAELLACEGSSDCRRYLGCISSCDGATCRQQCDATFASGRQLSAKIETCIAGQRAECIRACNFGAFPIQCACSCGNETYMSHCDGSGMEPTGACPASVCGPFSNLRLSITELPAQANDKHIFWVRCQGTGRCTSSGAAGVLQGQTTFDVSVAANTVYRLYYYVDIDQDGACADGDVLGTVEISSASASAGVSRKHSPYAQACRFFPSGG